MGAQGAFVSVRACRSVRARTRNRKRSILLWLTLTLVLPSCAHRKHVGSLPIIVDKREISAVKALIDTLRASPTTLSRQNRNNLIERLIGIADDHYMTVRDSLLESRNTVGFAAETAATTLSAVSALLGDADTKSILSTASTLTQSTKIGIDKSFFKEKSTEAIVAKMDSLRAERRQVLTRHESEEVANYGLEAALNDARQYDFAGRPETALIALASDAASQKADGTLNRHGFSCLGLFRRARVKDRVLVCALA